MSLLIADAGHSRLKVHLYQGSKIQRWVEPLRPFSWPQKIDPHEIDEVLFMGTHERHLVRLRSHLTQLGYPSPILLGVDCRVPMKGSERLQGVGNDRVANALGASLLFPRRECLVVSVGTALTLDRVDAEGYHLGGIIGMGWKHYRTSMLALDEKLQSSELDEPLEAVLGQRTVDCVRLGWLESALGLIQRCRHEGETLLFTGGDAQFLQAHFPEGLHCPHLAVDALAQVMGAYRPEGGQSA